MIKGLFETHLFVADLETSISFYQNTLQLQQCYFDKERQAAFFWIGQPRQAMLDLWEKPVHEIQRRHFAFECERDFVLNQAVQFLKDKGLQPYNFLKDGNEQPMVFAWMPAVAIYFNDPDGHYLEFIALLNGEPHPEAGIISYDEWKLLS